MLLGNHLTEKSATVQWVDVFMPQKRSIRPKDHKVLEQMAEHNPDRGYLWQSFGHTFRDQSLEDVCLYDLVANCKVEIMMETESTPNSKSLAFLIINCLIPKRRIKVLVLSNYCSVFPSRMRVVCSSICWGGLSQVNSSAYHAKLQ